VEKSKVPALGVELPAGLAAVSAVMPPLALLFMILLMNISLMSISAAEALLKAGAIDSVAVVLTLAVGLLGVLIVVTLVRVVLTPLPVLFRFAGSDDGGVSGALNPDTKVALLNGALPLAVAVVVLEVLELLLLPVDGFCSGMLSVSLSPPYFCGLASIQTQAHGNNTRNTTDKH